MLDQQRFPASSAIRGARGVKRFDVSTTLEHFDVTGAWGDPRHGHALDWNDWMLPVTVTWST